MSKTNSASVRVGTALMVSGTIGAGVLTLPYALVRVGMAGTIAYLVIFGIGFWLLNRMLIWLLQQQTRPQQLVGIVKQYLGNRAAIGMSGCTYVLLLSSLVIYTIGIGQLGAALFGGSALWWSFVWWLIAGWFVLRGLQTIKTIEFVLTLGLLLVMSTVVIWSGTQFNPLLWKIGGDGAWWYPYGIVLFAFHGVAAVPELYAIAKKNVEVAKRAVGNSSIIVFACYLLFTIMVLGVTGEYTTEIATVGLGERLGRPMMWFGNLFALLAMATSFFMNSVIWRDSLAWDYTWQPRYAALLVWLLPIVLVAAGIRELVSFMDIMGGIFVSLEIILLGLAGLAAKVTLKFK